MRSERAEERGGEREERGGEREERGGHAPPALCINSKFGV